MYILCYNLKLILCWVIARARLYDVYFVLYFKANSLLSESRSSPTSCDPSSGPVTGSFEDQVNVRLYIIPGRHYQYCRIKWVAFEPLYSNLRKGVKQRKVCETNFKKLQHIFIMYINQNMFETFSPKFSLIASRHPTLVAVVPSQGLESARTSGQAEPWAPPPPPAGHCPLIWGYCSHPTRA